MTATNPRLHDSAPAANGRRYTTEEREAAFLSWVAVDRRSFAKTGKSTAIAESTLREWARLDDWTGRAAEWDVAAAESARVGVFSTVTEELAKSIKTVVDIRDDPTQPGRVRLDAALAVLAIAGISTRPAPSAKPADSQPRAIPISMPPIRHMTVEEQRAAGDRLAAITADS
jgi:hypothetical protein